MEQRHTNRGNKSQQNRIEEGTKNGIEFTQSNCKASTASYKIKYNGQPN